MNKNLALVVGGIIFSLVAILHFFRLMHQWQVVIDGQNIPMSLSVVGLIITAILALWMFIAAIGKR